MKQQWHCEVCGKSGTAEYKESDTLFTALAKVIRVHKAASPKCKGNARKTYPAQGGHRLVDGNGVAVIVESK